MNSGILEALIVGNVQLPVSGPGGDDNRPCLNWIPIFEMKNVVRAGSAHPQNFAGDRKLSSKLLCLGHRAFREFLTGNAGWEAKIILNSRACAGLTTGSIPFDHGCGEAFGGRIYSCRQSSGTRTHDRHIVGLRAVAKISYAERICQNYVGRIPQETLTGKQSDGQLIMVEIEALLCFRYGVG